jgi:hypothetical protein
MQPVFNISPENIEPSKINLICEISEQGVAFVFQDTISKENMGLSVFMMKNLKEELSASLKKIFDEIALLKSNFNKVYISYSFPENILLPDNIEAEHHHKALSLLSGEGINKVELNDQISEKRIYNIYRVPVDVHKALLVQFPNAVFTHQYSYLLKMLSKEGDLLQVIF